MAAFAVVLIGGCSRESSDQTTSISAYEPVEHRHLVKLTPIAAALLKDRAEAFTVSIADTSRPGEAPASLLGAPVHVVIVSRDLRFFDHRHPKQFASGYQFSTQFPRDGEYVAFVYYRLREENVEVNRFPLRVGTQAPEALPLALTPRTSSVGGYEIALRLSPDPPGASDWTTLTFNVRKIGAAASSRTEEPGDHEVIIGEGATEFVYAHSTRGEARGGVRGALHLPLEPMRPSQDQEAPDEAESFHARFPHSGRYKVWFYTPNSHIATFVVDVGEAKPPADIH